MTWFLKIVFLVLVLSTLFYGVKRLPIIKNYYDCLGIAYTMYDETGIVLKRGNFGDEVVCLEKKTYLLQGLTCMAKSHTRYPLADREDSWLQQVAQWFRFGPKNFPSMIQEYNQLCPASKTTVKFDPKTQTWF